MRNVHDGQSLKHFTVRHRTAIKPRSRSPYRGVGLPCGSLRAGLLAVLEGFGGGGGAFAAELEPVLEVLLLLRDDGCAHCVLPRVKGHS